MVVRSLPSIRANSHANFSTSVRRTSSGRTSVESMERSQIRQSSVPGLEDLLSAKRDSVRNNAESLRFEDPSGLSGLAGIEKELSSLRRLQGGTSEMLSGQLQELQSAVFSMRDVLDDVQKVLYTSPQDEQHSFKPSPVWSAAPTERPSNAAPDAAVVPMEHTEIPKDVVPSPASAVHLFPSTLGFPKCAHDEGLSEPEADFDIIGAARHDETVRREPRSTAIMFRGWDSCVSEQLMPEDLFEGGDEDGTRRRASSNSMDMGKTKSGSHVENAAYHSRSINRHSLRPENEADPAPIDESQALDSTPHQVLPPSKSMLFESSGSREKNQVYSRGCGVLSPDSPRRNVWDILSFSILLYDCIMIPVILAWQPRESMFLTTGQYLGMMFWSFDMFLTFNTGVYFNGELEVRRSMIAKQYLKSAFLFDFLATASDWLTALASLLPENALQGNRAGPVLRVLKAQRAVRVLRFLRVSSMWARLEQLHMSFLSDAWQICFRICGIFGAIFLVNHFVACIWYAIGDSGHRDTGASWLMVEESFPDGSVQSYEEQSSVYQYWTSYHWSVTQMFEGSTQVTSRNTSERIFNVVCNLFGTFFSAVITSWLAALLVRHHQQKHDFEMVMKSVRRYLRHNNVHPTIANRIQKQLMMRLSERRQDSESDIVAFEKLSKTLKSEMRRDILSTLLFKSPMLILWEKLDRQLVHNICLYLEYHTKLVGEELFQPHVNMDKTHAIVRGELTYTFIGAVACDSSDMTMTALASDRVMREPSIDFCDTGTLEGLKSQAFAAPSPLPTHKVNDGQWISHAAIMLDWVTRGLMEATAYCELIAISTDMFSKSMSRSPRVQILMREYRRAYSELCSTLPSEELNDVESPVDHAMVVMIMEQSARLAVARPVLNELLTRERRNFVFQSRPQKGTAVLEAEVRNGECALVFGPDGAALRVAFVTALKVERQDGLILIQVAKLSQGRPVPKLQMPATKLKEGEVPSKAALRLLTQNLQEFGGLLGLGKREDGESHRMAATYGIVTRFFSTVFHVHCAPHPDSPQRITWSEHKTMSRSPSLDSHRDSTKKGIFSTPTLESGVSLKECMPLDLFLVRSEIDSGAIYAWMLPAAFEALSGKDGEKFLADWVQNIYVPPTKSPPIRPSVAPPLSARSPKTSTRSPSKEASPPKGWPVSSKIGSRSFHSGSVDLSSTSAALDARQYERTDSD